MFAQVQVPGRYEPFAKESSNFYEKDAQGLTVKRGAH